MVDSHSAEHCHAAGLDHFDAAAATWDDDPAKVTRARTVADAVRAAIPLNGTVRLLEYGAGTALVTQELQHSVGPITVVDTSAGMRAVIRAKIDDGVLRDCRTWEIDLLEESAIAEQFDLIVAVQVLHHVRAVDALLARFGELLAPGGHLCIADLEREDGSFHGAGADVHHGFDREDLGARLERAGFADADFQDCGSVDRNGTEFPLFLVTAVRRYD